MCGCSVAIYFVRFIGGSCYLRLPSLRLNAYVDSHDRHVVGCQGNLIYDIHKAEYQEIIIISGHDVLSRQRQHHKSRFVLQLDELIS